ncbi:MAG TPA: YciI family protein [Fimbriimonadaceae bacterium]|nr:YciI family protein [Fimbriimonadaceae bacterium]
MNLFLYRLIPPRPQTFAFDMTDEERLAMMKHVQYWTEQAKANKVLVFGPVADPEGTFGVAVLALDDADDPETLCKHDPTIEANLGFTYKLHPMPKFGIAAGFAL